MDVSTEDSEKAVTRCDTRRPLTAHSPQCRLTMCLSGPADRGAALTDVDHGEIILRRLIHGLLRIRLFAPGNMWKVHYFHFYLYATSFLMYNDYVQ